MTPAISLLVTEWLFIALVGVMAVLFVRVLGRALAGMARYRVTFLLLLVTLIVPMVLALSGQLNNYNAVPPPALMPVAIATIATIAISVSRIGARIAQRLALATLVGYQVFRVAVELLLHRLYLQGVVPVQMTFSGRNFDILSGLSAAVLGLWLLRANRPSRAVVLLWNVGGLALLVNIVTIAVLSAPVPFRTFHNEPANLLPGMFPYVWLPTFLVQAALFGHLLVFRALRRQR